VGSRAELFHCAGGGFRIAGEGGRLDEFEECLPEINDAYESRAWEQPSVLLAGNP
jgi:hypothetical protein